ncbi:MAG: molybdate ABC transporter substrate-binding protein [Planctomycetota bacterium]
MKSAAIVALALTVAVDLPGCARSDQAASTMTVAAAASLRDLLERTAPLFEAAHPGTHLAFSFEASSTLSRQIESGGEYQVFLSADRDNVDRVASLTEARATTAILSNTLVLVGREGLTAKVASPADLKSTAGRIALAGAKVPVGRYARAYLTEKHLLQELEPRIVTADDVRMSLAMVEAGSTDFAFVYLTDARSAQRCRLLWTAAREDDPGIVYVGTLITSFKTRLAEDYLHWLRGAEFLEVAQRMGFLPPPGE